MATETLYSTTVSVTGGRSGHATSDDGVLDIQFARPKTNGTAEGTNPEQLFGAAWGSCYQQAMQKIAEAEGVDAADSTVHVTIGQTKDDAGKYGLTAKIEVDIPGAESATVQKIADMTNKKCPYSLAVEGNIPVEVTAKAS